MIIRLDVQPATERSNAIRINLDDAIAPEIHKAESLAARAMAWASVEGLVAEGWASLGYRKHRRHGSPEDRNFAKYADLEVAFGAETGDHPHFWANSLESKNREIFTTNRDRCFPNTEHL